MMGPAAQARYKRGTVDLASTGNSDMAQVNKIADWLAGGDKTASRALVDRACELADQLIRDNWHTIMQMAE